MIALIITYGLNVRPILLIRISKNTMTCLLKVKVTHKGQTCLALFNYNLVGLSFCLS